MIQLLAVAAGLGLAGIDPGGALIAIGALAMGARERDVLGFGLVSILGTALLGTVLSRTVGQRLLTVRWSALLPPDRLAALIELLIAAGLVWWAVVRLRKPAARPPRPNGRTRTTGTALLGLAVLWAAAAVLDPTFVGLVVLAGREDSVLTVAAAHLLWILVSQAPLLALMVAIARGHEKRAVAWFQRVWERARPVTFAVGTGALLLAGAVLALDSLWWFFTERFLIALPE
jgi:hypothetical protein